jgi:lipoprotein-anchoring transpeptidase ErfK/SrfK
MMMRRLTQAALAAAALTALATPAGAMNADNRAPFFLFPFFSQPQQQVQQPQAAPQRYAYAAEPSRHDLSGQSSRETVTYTGNHAPGTVIINTSERRLYYVLGGGRALRYAVGVGREGFQWSGIEKISNKQEWPDWRPPEDMLRRRPDLPRYMAGGPGNPLGARALYLGASIYRIHGSNEPETIGRAVSSGCIRMHNDDVVDLYNRVKVGTQVVVLR